MGIKPALGWLALLLFTTSAQAGGSSVLGANRVKVKTLANAPPSAPVATPPAPRKAPDARITPVVAVAAPLALVVVESTTKPRVDYQAETYSGVPLDAPFAKERGLDKGLVTLVFEGQRRAAAFRVGKERIRRALRLDESASLAVTTGAGGARAISPRSGSADHFDVLDTDDGVIVVHSATQSGGMFTTSEVYAFPLAAVTLEQRVAVLEASRAPARDRVRQALVVAEWAR